ncbi:MAG: BrnT family toxin [Rhodospirillaceae bacterium]|nr:BrnT family toxin [Rhodospirillaceae bacterium]
MEFEFDPAKSAANKLKHGIDFNQATALWDDPGIIEIPMALDDEPRFLVVGRLGEKHWSAVITYRGERIRLTSVRRSREKEIEGYESARI